MADPGMTTVEVTSRSLVGPHGDIPVRCYRPDHGALARGLVWLHGGGWMSGDLDMPEADWVARYLAGRGIAVVSVDYRLAPFLDYMADETPEAGGSGRFPVAHDEAVAVFEQVHADADRFGIEVGRVSLGGASAGSNLAAGAALALRDRGGAAPSTLVLAYPALHARTPPVSEELEAQLVTVDDAALFPTARLARLVHNYVDTGDAASQTYAFPGGHDLRGTPPTFIVTSQFDSLRPSGEAYAAELAAAGVEVMIVCESGTLHGHLNRPEERAAWLSAERMARWILRA